MKNLVFLFLTLIQLSPCTGQTEKKTENQKNTGEQRANNNYLPPAFEPKYINGNSPTIYLDEAHFNFHTMNGRYKAFASVLSKDGYLVAPFVDKFTRENLSKVEILVVANAFGDSTNWKLPTLSAFSKEEIKVVNDWVYKGGALFLIADHMPAAGASTKLAFSFGFNFINGYLYNFKTFSDVDIFSKTDGSLTETFLTKGIDSVASFTGQAFFIPENAKSIMNVGEDYIIYLPSEIGKISGSKTPKFYAKGLSQGAIIEYGKGRIAVFGEAGMFTSQWSGESGDEEFIMGMNNENASHNHLLLLNIVHWLDETLPNN